MQYPKSTYDFHPKELCNVFTSNCGHRFASTHFVKLSIVMTKIFTFPGASGKELAMSIPHCKNGHGLVILIIGIAALLYIGNVFHIFHTYVGTLSTNNTLAWLFYR